MSFDVPYEFDERNTVIIQHALLNKSLRVLPNNPRRIDHNGSTGKFARWHADPQEEGEKVRFKSTRTNKYLRIIQNRDKYIVDVAGTGGKFTVFNPETIENGQILLESDAFPGVYIAVDNKGVRTGSGGKLCNLRIMQQNEDSGSSTESDEEDDKKSGMFYSTAGGPDDADADEEYEMVQTKKAQSPQQEEDEEDEDSIIIHSEQKDIEGDAVTPAGGDSNDSHDSHDDDDDDDDDSEDSAKERLLSDILNRKLLEGYCMVFDREREYFELVVADLRDVGHPKRDLALMDEMCAMRNVYGIRNDNDKTLQWVRKADIADEEFAEKAPGRAKAMDAKNILRGFNAAHIQYKIIWSRPSLNEQDKINPNDDAESKYVYVVMWMDAAYTEEYADYQDLSVLINREEAIEAGRGFCEFHLAHRTYLASRDADDQVAINESSDDESDEDSRSVIVTVFPELKMLPIECWNNIHIPFEASIKLDEDQFNIYELYPAANDPSYKTVIHHRLYLRILYSCLVDDAAMKGANFQVDRYVADKNNPFVAIFALHEFDNRKFYPTRPVPQFAEKLFSCGKTLGWIGRDTARELVDDVREYYGEYIAFYYGFLTHYIDSLLPMVVIGLIWFVVQLSAGTISVGGSAFYVLICVLWSTITIETWYRRESALKFKWGMCRYRETEVPRPMFRGKVKISYYNGDIIEDHSSIYKYWLKIAFSLSTMLLCIAIVIVIVGSIWILKRKWKNDPGYKMAIGVINAIQIKVFNFLYTKLAYALNNFEQHRLVVDYHNHLVVKRIIFMVVNSFNSLFYMAFYDDSYVDNEDRLNSLRIQLFTLFFTSIVIMNFLEIVIPQIPQWVRNYKQKKAANNENLEEHMAIQHVQDETMQNVDELGDEELQDPRFNGGADKMIIFDIEKQLNSPSVASNLDNVAEIVILQGYIIVFAVVLPIMPLLAFLNSILEIRIDVYNLTGAKRAIPFAADGLGVWRAVLSCFNTLAVFSNMAVIAWDTNLTEMTLHLGESGKIIWYFTICIAILAVMISIRIMFPNESRATQQAIARQEQCENLVTLLQDSKHNHDDEDADTSKKTKKKKKKQKKHRH
eukprot:816506_1